MRKKAEKKCGEECLMENRHSSTGFDLVNKLREQARAVCAKLCSRIAITWKFFSYLFIYSLLLHHFIAHCCSGWHFNRCAVTLLTLIPHSHVSCVYLWPEFVCKRESSRPFSLALVMLCALAAAPIRQICEQAHVRRDSVDSKMVFHMQHIIRFWWWRRRDVLI